ncbi:MAG: hypothetical protein RLZZ26_470 [Candidatus Parcubacteria bacterium]|jgi:hypothetical protein
MNIFTPTTFTWWQMGLLKWAVLCIGIAIGSTWPGVFAPHSVALLVVGLVISAYLAVVWFNKK